MDNKDHIMTKALLSLFLLFSACCYAHQDTKEITSLDYFPDSELYNARSLPAPEGKLNSKENKKYFLQSTYSFGEMFNNTNKYEELYEKSLLSDIALLNYKIHDYKAPKLPDCSTLSQQADCLFIKSYFDEINTAYQLYKEGGSVEEIKAHINANAQANKANFVSLVENYHSQNHKDALYEKMDHDSTMTASEKKEIIKYCDKDVYFRGITNDNDKFSYLHFRKENNPASEEKINQILYRNSLAIFMVKLKSDYYNQSLKNGNDFDKSLSFFLNIYSR